DQMHLLFYQLFENAIRFRKEGTRAKIKFEAKRLMKNRFRNIEGKYRYAPFFQIDINDDGIGFAAEFKDEAFELFKRMHKQSGLGLGLSLCKKIIDNHEGMISIDTVPGKGTTVSILLPDDAAHGMKNDA
ncbi:MAG TPA: ATP-binding protein, partial [Flavisolibacter sp.]|nr:ATP-binding protein [Flavisolibacter sp.]